MKICPFCDTTHAHQQSHLHSDIIHMYIHYSNTQLQQTRDVSNTDIAIALKYLGVLFAHVPYLLTSDCEPFSSFLSTLLHQYDDNTRHDTPHMSPLPPHSYQHTTLNPRTYRSITSLAEDWVRIRPNMTPDSPDCMTYTHGLVFSLPPSNYSRVIINVIDHIYIGILPQSTHTTIRHQFSAFVTQQ